MAPSARTLHRRRASLFRAAAGALSSPGARRGAPASRPAALALVAAALLAGAACGKRARVSRQRGDAAPVVVVERGAGGLSFVDEREPNETAAAASPLTVPGGAHGALAGDADVDVFKLVATAPGVLRALVRPQKGGDRPAGTDAPGSDEAPAIDLKMELRDEANKLLARSDAGGAGATEGLPNFAVAPGSYYLVVAPVVRKGRRRPARPRPGAPPEAAAPGRYELLASWQTEVEAGLESEPNGDASRPVELAAGQDGRGYLGWSGDVDFWKLVLSAPAAPGPGAAPPAVPAPGAGAVPGGARGGGATGGGAAGAAATGPGATGAGTTTGGPPGIAPAATPPAPGSPPPVPAGAPGAPLEAIDLEVDGVPGLALKLALLDAGGAVVAQREGGKGLALAIRGMVPVPGQTHYFARLSPVGGRSGPEETYVLRWQRRPLGSDEEIEPNDAMESAAPLRADPAELEGVRRGQLVRGDVDHFRLEPGGAAQLLNATVEPASSVDVELALMTADGRELAAASGNGRGGAEQLVGLAVPAGSEAVLRIRVAGGGDEVASYVLRWTLVVQ